MPVIITATEYTVSVLPLDDINGYHFSLVLTRATDGRWSVRQQVRRDFYLNAKGKWDQDPGPERSKKWVDAHRFDLETARRLAEAAAPRHELNRTVAGDLVGQEPPAETATPSCLDLWRDATDQLIDGPTERTLLLTATSDRDDFTPVATAVLQTPAAVDAAAAADWLHAALEPMLGNPTLSVTAVPVDDDAGTDWSRRGVTERYPDDQPPATLQAAATLSEKLLMQLTTLQTTSALRTTALGTMATDIRRLAASQPVIAEATRRYESHPDDGTMRAEAADAYRNDLEDAARQLEAGDIQQAIEVLRRLQFDALNLAEYYLSPGSTGELSAG